MVTAISMVPAAPLPVAATILSEEARQTDTPAAVVVEPAGAVVVVVGRAVVVVAGAAVVVVDEVGLEEQAASTTAASPSALRTSNRGRRSGVLGGGP
jgi:hypothetical protein